MAMSWGSRQKRLKDMLGAQNNMCLQICVCVTKNLTAAEFDTYIKENNIDLPEGKHIQLPRVTYQEKIFPPGFLYNGDNKTKMGKIISTQDVVTIAPYKLIGNDPDTSNAAHDINKIIQAYIPEIEKRFPDLKFKDRRYVDGDRYSIEFRYVVMPYSPEICHPRDIGKFKPITIIDNCTIKPSGRISIKDLEL